MRLFPKKDALRYPYPCNVEVKMRLSRQTIDFRARQQKSPGTENIA
jgi:hypothetical protein